MKPDMSNCEFCRKVLSREKGEEDHGCLDCFGYIYLVNDVYVCFHCIETENKKLRDEVAELKQKLKNVWKEAEEFYLED